MAIISPILDIFIHVYVVGVCRLLPVPDVTATVPVVSTGRVGTPIFRRILIKPHIMEYSRV